MTTSHDFVLPERGRPRGSTTTKPTSYGLIARHPDDMFAQLDLGPLEATRPADQVDDATGHVRRTGFVRVAAGTTVTAGITCVRRILGRPTRTGSRPPG